MKFVIITVCGICWSLAYILAIRRGIKDRTYGFPALAVLFNVAWELVYSFVYPDSSPVGMVALAWLVLDLVILFQVFKYWKSSSLGLRNLSPFLMLAGGLSAALGVILYGEFNGVWLIASAFGQNLLMSILFVVMLFTRKTPGGQSIYIGLLKMMGTGIVVLPLLLSASQNASFLKNGVYSGILLFDLIYVIGLSIILKRNRIPVFKRI